MKAPTIVSGGQTGVDQAALDSARELGLEYGGYVPRGRWTEDGPLPPEYKGMIETDSSAPSKRTKLNVRESDATLIITRGACEGGTLLTAETARKSGKPHLIVDLDCKSESQVSNEISEWLHRVAPAKLNVAGPRASKDPAIYAEAKCILLRVCEKAAR